MPNNSEHLLISSLLRDNDFAVALGAGLKQDMFHSYPDEWAFLEDYFRKYRKMPTKIAFKRQFRQFPDVSAVNDTGHFSSQVIKSHTRSRLTASMRDVTDYIANGDIDSAVKTMYSEIITISAEVGGGGDIDVINDYDTVFQEAAEKAQRVEDEGMAGIPTGFPTLDEKTGGVQPGEFWIPAARPSEGKSWTMMRWASNALAAGHRVQYNTLEMSRTQVAMRTHTLLSSQVGTNIFKNLDLQQGKNFDAKAYRQFLRELKHTIHGSFHITDGSRGRISPMTIAAQIERNNPSIVFIDYITLMDGAIGGDWKAIGQLSGELKSLAQQYKVALVGASQLNRSAAGTKEAVSGTDTISQADALGQDADGVITIRKISDSVLQYRMAKYRHGPSNFKWYTDFRPSDGVYEECSYERAMQLKDIDDDKADLAAIQQKSAERQHRNGLQRRSKTLVKRPTIKKAII